MISTLDFVFIVLGVGLIPFFILLCMVLYRAYKMMDHIENILSFTEKTTQFMSNLDRVPMMVATGVIGKIHQFFSK